MADIRIIKLKVRRGTNSQRQQIILEQGELGYTVDTQRLFVGNGILSGGLVVGSMSHPPLINNDSRIYLNNSLTNDIVNENGFLYQLSGSDYSKLSSWAFIGTNPDNSSLQYNASRKIEIKDGGVTSYKLNPSAVYSLGGLELNTVSGLSANVDNITLKITNTNQLSVSKIDQNHITSYSLGYGLTGGDGDILRVNAGDGFSTSTGFLQITGLPLNTVILSSIDSSAIGRGLSLSAGELITNVSSGDEITVTNNAATGVLSLRPIHGGGSTIFSNIEYNQYGQVTSLSSSIITTFSGSDASKPYFNGDPAQEIYSNQTLYTVISTFYDPESEEEDTTSAITLSSAGFMAIDTSEGIFAIPVFKF